MIHGAAITDVDGCESQAEFAMAINGEASGVLARGAAEIGARCVYVSTDYVFDGAKDAPYLEDDPTGPATAYGRSKLRGEERVVGGVVVAELDDVDAAAERPVEQELGIVERGGRVADEVEPRAGELVEAGGHGVGRVGDRGATTPRSPGSPRRRISPPSGPTWRSHRQVGPLGELPGPGGRGGMRAALRSGASTGAERDRLRGRLAPPTVRT